MKMRSSKYSESETKELLVTELSSILNATKAEVGREVEVLGLTYPIYIESVNIVYEAGIQVLPGFDNGLHAQSYLQSVRKASHLDNAESLGYPAGTDIDREDPLLIQIDYQGSLLEASITSVGANSIGVEWQF